MTPTPTGRLVEGPDGLELVVTRTLPRNIHEAWAYISESDLTATWIGRWRGTSAPGETIEVQMGFEEDSSWMELTITECDAPSRLRLLSNSGDNPWDVSFDLSSVDDNCLLRFAHHRITPAEVGDVGPGWEYYLDQLVAAVTDSPLPNWDDYYPALKTYFEAQVV